MFHCSTYILILKAQVTSDFGMNRFETYCGDIDIDISFTEKAAFILSHFQKAL